MNLRQILSNRFCLHESPVLQELTGNKANILFYCHAWLAMPIALGGFCESQRAGIIRNCRKSHFFIGIVTAFYWQH